MNVSSVSGWCLGETVTQRVPGPNVVSCCLVKPSFSTIECGCFVQVFYDYGYDTYFVDQNIHPANVLAFEKYVQI